MAFCLRKGSVQMFLYNPAMLFCPLSAIPHQDSPVTPMPGLKSARVAAVAG
jgi:hypothetical protein